LRATRAYITGFGTTGLLIASALLTLFVMSAFVAFNGFPGQDVQDPIGTLLLQQRQAPVSVPAKPVRVHVLAARKGAVASHRAGTTRSHAPTANTGPVAQRTPAQTPTQTPAPAPGSGQASTPLTQSTPPLDSGTTPSLPDTGTPQVPSVSVPSLPPPPTPSQLPIDTSGVTSLLGGQ
jgi:hypothetical protein